MYNYKNIVFIIAIIINFTSSFFTIWNTKKYTREIRKSKQVIGTVLLIIISVGMLSIDVIVLLRSIKIIAVQSYKEWAALSAAILNTIALTLLNVDFLISSFTFLIAKKSGKKDIKIISMASLVTSILSIFIATPVFSFINFCLGVIAIAVYKTTPKISSSVERSKPSSICPKCGAPVSGNKQFCTKCGEKLSTI